MTTTHNEIFIAAPPSAIYRYACATERWPEILPHYRFVRVLEDRGLSRIVEMGARRNWIPVRWVAEQTNNPDRPHIRFRHVAGWTRGMDVEWIFEPVDGGTRVVIDHRLHFRFPFAAEFLGKWVVGDFFVGNIAGKTLARMKELVEAESRA
ncbi:MAG: SRPBCC family protein [Candidatus Eremiobacteraeota bacterium]|nr:SRPBCC family protein [Candidatus Eremiobacteraeota bacterium]